ncbi:hypothetical protein ACUTJJ_05235 [Agrobacterium sp. DKPNP3]|uniref:hypothetical protein n=1 Tax=Agrobacterium sp. DKPNP3 TaxID=3457323 RepID=UPI0040440A32
MSIFARILLAFAFTSSATLASATAPDEEIIALMEKNGFHGETPHVKMIGREVKFSQGGEFTAIVDYVGRDASVKVKGVFSDNSLKIVDTDFVGNGKRIQVGLGCNFTFTEMYDENVGMEGTYTGCGGGTAVKKVKLWFGTKEDVQKKIAASDNSYYSEYAVAAVDYVEKNCDYLAIDDAQFGAALSSRGYNATTARQGKYYKRNSKNYQDAKAQGTDVCHEIQAAFIVTVPKDMQRMILRRDNPFR